MSSTFVVCTLNRPDELLVCLRTIAAQSVPPGEVVVVDASDRPDPEPMRGVVEGAGIRFVHMVSAPGLPRQRNAGVRASTGNPVCFVDDDVELDPGFHAGIVRAFEEAEVGGVQGTIAAEAPRAWPFRAFRALFLLSRRTRDARGRLLPSGYYTMPTGPTVVREATVIRGSGFAFRRAVLDEFAFDESLEGYALKEDVDFSYRVGRRWRLLITPDARYRHHKSPTARPAVREKSRMHVVNNYRLFRKNMAGTARQRAAFAWAMTGRLLYDALRTVVKRNPGYILGTLDGLREILRRPTASTG